jgi:hypothetical protein
MNSFLPAKAFICDYSIHCLFLYLGRSSFLHSFLWQCLGFIYLFMKLILFFQILRSERLDDMMTSSAGTAMVSLIEFFSFILLTRLFYPLFDSFHLLFLNEICSLTWCDGEFDQNLSFPFSKCLLSFLSQILFPFLDEPIQRKSIKFKLIMETFLFLLT